MNIDKLSDLLRFSSLLYCWNEAGVQTSWKNIKINVNLVKCISDYQFYRERITFLEASDMF